MHFLPDETFPKLISFYIALTFSTRIVYIHTYLLALILFPIYAGALLFLSVPSTCKPVIHCSVEQLAATCLASPTFHKIIPPESR